MKCLNTTLLCFVNAYAVTRFCGLALVSWLLLAPALLAEKAEIKMLIDQSVLPHAKSKLKAAPAGDPEVRVCFFDTPEARLNDKNLILRARLGKDVDAVVKLRGTNEPPGNGFPTLEKESDWVAPGDVKTSYSIKTDNLDEAKMRDVIDGKLELHEILSDEQKRFAATAAGMKAIKFPWGDLRRYGVIEAWKSKIDLSKFKDVTVEFWRLTKGGTQLELLEISIKTGKKDSKDKRPVKEIADEFYQAAKDAGLGTATGESKTQKVMEFFKPGIK